MKKGYIKRYPYKMICLHCDAIETYPVGLAKGEYILRHAPNCKFTSGLVVLDGQLPSKNILLNPSIKI